MLARMMVLTVIAGVSLVGCGDEDPAGSEEADGTTTSAPATSTFSAPATTSTTVGLSAQAPLRLDGIGPITVGMTMEEASAASGHTFTATDENSPSNLCSYADYSDPVEGLGFMVERDTEAGPWRIVRIDVGGDPAQDPKVATEAGIRVGATEDEVKAAYGADKLKVEDHEYVDGHYLTYDEDGDGGNALLFETDGPVVSAFRSGQDGPVSYVEGCA